MKPHTGVSERHSKAALLASTTAVLILVLAGVLFAAELGGPDNLAPVAAGQDLCAGETLAPGQRPPAHGTWRPDGGRGYIQKAVALIGFTTPPSPPFNPGFEAGWQTITHRVEMIDADNMESSGTNAFYRTSGELYRTGCSTAVAVSHVLSFLDR